MTATFRQTVSLTDPSKYELSTGTAVRLDPMVQQRDSYDHNWFGAITSACGDDGGREVPVNDSTALSYPPFYRACTLISQSVAKLKLNLHKETSSGKRKKKKKHHAHKLLNRKPHAWINDFTFFETMQFHAIRNGNGYAYISRDGNGQAVDLTILDPRQVKPMIAIDDRDEEEILVYKVSFPDVPEPIYLPFKDVLHIKGLSNDAIVGMDIIKIFKGEIGLGLVTTDHRLEFYKDGGVGGGILMFKKGLSKSKQDETERYWNEARKGRKAGTRVTKLRDDTTWAESSANARNSQTAETREFQIAMASAITGAPQHKLGGKRLTSHNSLEEENRSWLDDVLDPWLCKWQIECMNKLLTDREIEKGYYFEFDVTKYERQSLKDTVEAGRIVVNEGLSTLNDWNERLNLPPVKDGDRLRIPLNIGFADDPDRIKEEKERKPDPVDNQLSEDQRAAVSVAIENSVKTACRRLGNAVESASKSEEKFANFLEEMSDRHEEPVNEIMASANSLCKAFSLPPVPDLIGRFKNSLGESSHSDAGLLATVIKTNWPQQITNEILESCNA